jgi:site-specific recombinase XerD
MLATTLAGSFTLYTAAVLSRAGAVRVLLKYLPFRFGRDWLQKLIRRAMNAAGFQHLTLHDLRHSTASAMTKNGIDLYTVGAVLGHKDQRSTKRYAHLATRTLNAAILKVK